MTLTLSRPSQQTTTLTSLPVEGVVLAPTLTLEEALDAFVRALAGQNRSELTIQAYWTDVGQFLAWLHQTNFVATMPHQVTKADLTEYLGFLGNQGRSGVTRARKLAALREFFRFLEVHELIPRSPAINIDTPKRERRGRTYLRVDEFTKLLSLAGAHPRDFCILQLFLQTGIRVSELCDLRLGDIDLIGRTLSIANGKGRASRVIELEKKGIQALRTYMAVRPSVPYTTLFLNRDQEPLGERGVKKLVAKYLQLAGITRKVSCHSLRHTFGTYKAEQGVSPYQLKEWLGHANLNTTQIYVHLSRQNAKKVMEGTSL
ncbi:MAG: tyrosine-type recombinase/integrase [Dehalococcoidia bacterium]